MEVSFINLSLKFHSRNLESKLQCVLRGWENFKHLQTYYSRMIKKVALEIKCTRSGCGCSGFTVSAAVCRNLAGLCLRDWSPAPRMCVWMRRLESSASLDVTSKPPKIKNCPWHPWALNTWLLIETRWIHQGLSGISVCVSEVRLQHVRHKLEGDSYDLAPNGVISRSSPCGVGAEGKAVPQGCTCYLRHNQLCPPHPIRACLSSSCCAGPLAWAPCLGA